MAEVQYTFAHLNERQSSVQAGRDALDQFLAEVERPAYRMAQVSTRHPDDALDIVQDAMIKLVEKYADKPREEWRPLFYAILHSRITDYHRKKSLTGRLFSWLGSDDDESPVEEGSTTEGPLEQLTGDFTLEQLNDALHGLPTRQQQVFMLRTWQGFSVAETAGILKCSEGTVKTHLSRATETLMKSVSQGEDDD